MYSSGLAPSGTLLHQFSPGRWDKASSQHSGRHLALFGHLWAAPAAPFQVSHTLLCVMWGGLLSISISSSPKREMEAFISWKNENKLTNPHKELKAVGPNCLVFSEHYHWWFLVQSSKKKIPQNKVSLEIKPSGSESRTTLTFSP